MARDLVNGTGLVAGVALMEEQELCKFKVAGSTPVSGSKETKLE